MRGAIAPKQSLCSFIKKPTTRSPRTLRVLAMTKNMVVIARSPDASQDDVAISKTRFLTSFGITLYEHVMELEMLPISF